MKTYISLASFIAVILLFAACSNNKSYTCTCEGGLTGQGTTVTISGKSQQDAVTACSAHNDPPNTADGYTNCHIQ